MRLGKLGISQQAELGQAAISSVAFDDTAGTLGHLSDGIIGLKQFDWDETAAPAGNRRIWTGYIGNRHYRRGTSSESPSLIQDAARVIDATLIDINSFLSFRRFLPTAIDSTSDFVRPAETDVARVQALLTSVDFLTTTLYNELGYLSTAGPVNMDAMDYTGQTPADALNDCSQQSGKNHFLVYNEATGHYNLFYDKNTSTAYRTTMRVSNVGADVDNSTTWYPLIDGALDIDPSRVVAGVLMPYDGVDKLSGTIATNTLGAGGTGYVVNDTFTINGGLAGLLAAGIVDTVTAGVVATYHLTADGAGYSVGTGRATTATSGVGTGLTINIDSLTPVGMVYRKNLTTSYIYGYRDAMAPSANVKTETIANARADRYLNENATEDHRLTFSVFLPAANVNDWRVGQAGQVKFQHLPGLSTFTYVRCLKRTVYQKEETDIFYTVEYECTPAPAACGPWNLIYDMPSTVGAFVGRGAGDSGHSPIVRAYWKIADTCDTGSWNLYAGVVGSAPYGGHYAGLGNGPMAVMQISEFAAAGTPALVDSQTLQNVSGSDQDANKRTIDIPDAVTESALNIIASFPMETDTSYIAPPAGWTEIGYQWRGGGAGGNLDSFVNSLIINHYRLTAGGAGLDYADNRPSGAVDIIYSTARLAFSGAGVLVQTAWAMPTSQATGPTITMPVTFGTAPTVGNLLLAFVAVSQGFYGWNGNPQSDITAA